MCFAFSQPDASAMRQGNSTPHRDTVECRPFLSSKDYAAQMGTARLARPKLLPLERVTCLSESFGKR